MVEIVIDGLASTRDLGGMPAPMACDTSDSDPFVPVY